MNSTLKYLAILILLIPSYLGAGETFSPAPGEQLSLNRKTLRTTIDVIPAKNQCLIITKSPDVHDELVCKKTKVFVHLEDLDMENGSLTWKYKIKGTLDEKSVSWRSTHFVAKGILIGHEMGVSDSKPYPMHSCTYLEKEKIIDLKLMDNSHWKLDFSEKPLERKEPKEDEKPERWNLSVQKTEDYPASMIRTFEASLPPVKKGMCRLERKNLIQKVARLECHDTIEFAYLYIPLPCLP